MTKAAKQSLNRINLLFEFFGRWVQLFFLVLPKNGRRFFLDFVFLFVLQPSQVGPGGWVARRNFQTYRSVGSYSSTWHHSLHRFKHKCTACTIAHSMDLISLSSSSPTIFRSVHQNNFRFLAKRI